MRRTITILLVCAALLPGLVGCSPREYTSYALAEICEQAGSREYVTVSGMIKIPRTIRRIRRTYLIHVVEDIDQQKPILQIGIQIGNRNNRIEKLTDEIVWTEHRIVNSNQETQIDYFAELPDHFNLTDIVIRTNDGQIVTHGSPVRVSGFFGGRCIPSVTDLKVELIEAQ